MRKTILILLLLAGTLARAEEKSPFMTNVYGRERVESLGGQWNAIVDLYDLGRDKEIYLDRKAVKGSEFYEYSWEGGLRLNVPGDWNSQDPELKYFEGTVWYARHFNYTPDALPRRFLYFAAVSLRCNVYLNGEKIAEHEGAFTPFQVEVTDRLREGDNFLCVEVNNRRREDAIPALSYDWWSYGGITRDVFLIAAPKVFLHDYSLALDRNDPSKINVSVTLSDAVSQDVSLNIAELGIRKILRTDASGRAETVLKAPKTLVKWAPDAPRLYEVVFTAGQDTVREKIGFRTLGVEGTSILVNGEKVFMRGVSFHEEIAQRMGRAFSASDARVLLSEAAALGVNMVRLAHYPQNEYIVRLAEEMGILLWEEIPLWQSIDFGNPRTRTLAVNMYKEMIWRDHNRCAVSFWGIANETKPGEVRDNFLTEVLETARSMDAMRLFAIANDVVYYSEQSGFFEMHDDFVEKLDVVGVNKYMGWYAPWPMDPEDCIWRVALDKPLIITEFGGEALYGRSGPDDWADSWSEDYQARLYRDNLAMFARIPNLAGVSPWVLFDFRSPYRYHPVNQEGWNRKGLVSDQGQRKKAWYIMHDYYQSLKNRK